MFPSLFTSPFDRSICDTRFFSILCTVVIKRYHFIPVFLGAHVRDPGVEIVCEELLGMHEVEAEVVETVYLRHDASHVVLDQVLVGRF
jgi:hypothetical protein